MAEQNVVIARNVDWVHHLVSYRLFSMPVHVTKFTYALSCDVQFAHST